MTTKTLCKIIYGRAGSNEEFSRVMAELGKRGGRSTSHAKRDASRRNAKLARDARAARYRRPLSDMADASTMPQSGECGAGMLVVEGSDT